MLQSRTLLAISSLAVLLATGCSSTKLTSVWENPSYRGGSFKKLLIIALGVRPDGRAEFENSVGDALASRGVLGVASVGYFADQAEMTREAVRGWVERDGYQGVLVTRLVDARQTLHVQPPEYTDLWSYWGTYGTAMTPGHVVDDTKLRIDTDLFDAVTGQVVYTAESKSSDPKSREQLIQKLTTLLVNDLTKRGLLPPHP